MSPDLQAVLDALNAERYGRNQWWKTPTSERPPTPETAPNFDDSELTCGKRRRAMVEDFKRLDQAVAS